MKFWRTKEPMVQFGTTHARFPLPAPQFGIPLAACNSHLHVIGISGSGKSRWLAGYILALLRHGRAVTLLDPQRDLYDLVVRQLVAAGTWRNPANFDRFVLLNIQEAEQRQRFLAFNPLTQSDDPYTSALNITEALHRAWSSLAGGVAPMFDTLIQNGVKALISNGLPLNPSLYRLLTDKDFRDQLLANEPDADVSAFFHGQFDRLAPHDQADQAGAALRRAHLLTFAPVLKYSLGQAENRLNFRDIMDSGTSVLMNLHMDAEEPLRLLGCLLTVALEYAALSRANVPAAERKHNHWLVMDEFSLFSASSEKSLARILSLCRKYGFYVVLAHQDWDQTHHLKGALQNVGLEAVFKLGFADATYTAPMLCKVNPMAVKHEVENPDALERTHPVFYSLAEQEADMAQTLYNLPDRQAFIRQRSGEVTRLTKTMPVPDPSVDPAEVQAVEDYYLEKYFRSQAEIEQESRRYREATTVLTQRHKPVV
jgi:hypothetical protein